MDANFDFEKEFRMERVVRYVEDPEILHPNRQRTKMLRAKTALHKLELENQFNLAAKQRQLAASIAQRHRKIKIDNSSR